MGQLRCLLWHGRHVAAFAFIIVVLILLADTPPLAGYVSQKHYHDLGKLLLAFVMFWCYVAFAQYLIIWAGNLPEEIPWYLRRLQGGWGWIGLALLLFHFVLPFLILAAIITVYILLGVLYESYIHPITILSTLPSAGVGALLALQLFDTEFSIIAFIGVILLIGIVKKNAIMMIDFALDAERDPIRRAQRLERAHAEVRAVLGQLADAVALDRQVDLGSIVERSGLDLEATPSLPLAR